MPDNSLLSYFLQIAPSLNTVTAFALVLAVLVPLEVLFPARPLRWRNRSFHLIYLLVTLPLSLALLNAVIASLFHISFADGSWVKAYQASIPASFYESLPRFELGPILDKTPIPIFLWLLLSLFVSDLGFYWVHRILHRFPILWPLHKLHHTDTNLNTMTAFMTHALDIPLTSAATRLAVPWITLLIAGYQFEHRSSFADSLLMSFITLELHFWFSHANIKVNLGPLTRVVLGPQAHRIHHSIHPHHANKNFSSVFPFWDIVFGTYWHPGKDEWPETGLPGEEMPKTQLQAVLLPVKAYRELFARWRLRRESRSVETRPHQGG